MARSAEVRRLRRVSDPFRRPHCGAHACKPHPRELHLPSKTRAICRTISRSSRCVLMVVFHEMERCSIEAATSTDGSELPSACFAPDDDRFWPSSRSPRQGSLPIQHFRLPRSQRAGLRKRPRTEVALVGRFRGRSPTGFFSNLFCSG